MPPTTGYSFGDIVLVSFPFTNQIGQKQRPAAVVNSAAYQRQRPDVILMAVTSQIQPSLGFGEALVQDWQGAGLLKPSALKPVVFTAEKAIVRKTLGRLKAQDQQALRKIIETIFG